MALPVPLRGQRHKSPVAQLLVVRHHSSVYEKKNHYLHRRGSDSDYSCMDGISIFADRNAAIRPSYTGPDVETYKCGAESYERAHRKRFSDRPRPFLPSHGLYRSSSGEAYLLFPEDSFRVAVSADDIHKTMMPNTALEPTPTAP